MLETGQGSGVYSGGSNLPRIGITMGDAAGIGPEITLKALSDENLLKVFRPIVIGDLAFLQSSANELGMTFEFASFDPDADLQAGRVYIADCRNLPSDIAVGRETAEVGRAAAQYVEKAVELWRGGMIDAVATAPINKKSIHLGGYDFPGHTELLAELTGTKRFAMSFFAERLRVVLLSTHIPLSDAISRIRKDAIVDIIRFSEEQLAMLLNRKIRLAVAGVNPHASEGGLFGDEEASEIEPAIEQCREEFKIDVSGPYSPDTIFLRGFRGEFEAVIACYHDQATIAVKALSFGSSVNVTLGLPLIRTSVDHGTAFDIAGKCVADDSSMKAAIRLASDLALIRTRAQEIHI